MTSVFSADGKNVPCTVIEVGPCVVTQIKTLEKDGYEAVQVGFQEKKEKHTNKAEAGLFKKAGVAPQRHLAEFKSFETTLSDHKLCAGRYFRKDSPKTDEGSSGAGLSGRNRQSLF